MNEKNNATLQLLSHNTQFKETKYNTFILFLKLIKLFLFKWGTNQLFPYHIYRDSSSLYTVGTPVHFMELESFTKEEPLYVASCNFSVTQVISLKLKHINKIFSQMSLFRRFTYILNSIYFESISNQLETTSKKYSPDKLTCFELGYTGLAISETSKSLGLRSRYIQHGLQDTLLKPISFNEYYLWTKDDLQFFACHASYAQIHFMYPIAPLTKKNIKSNIAMLAIDYPTKNLSHETMKAQAFALQNILNSFNINLVVRLHPRMLKKTNLSEFFIDPYQELSIEESFKKNSAETFFAFNSASLIKIRSTGHPCAYLKNKNNELLRTPFSNYATKLESEDDIKSFIQLHYQ